MKSILLIALAFVVGVVGMHELHKRPLLWRSCPETLNSAMSETAARQINPLYRGWSDVPRELIHLFHVNAIQLEHKHLCTMW